MLVLYGRLTFQPACVFRGLNKGLSCVCAMESLFDLQSWAESRLRGPVFFLHVVTCGEVAWFVSVWEVFVEQKWPLLPGGNYECK